jgi:hypothetical protein
MAFREIEKLMSLKEAVNKNRMFRTLLKGPYLSCFEHNLKKGVKAENSDILDNELIELVLRDIGLEYIPKRTIRIQKYYMRQRRNSYMDYMGLNMSIQQFVETLNGLNRYLLFFP